MDFLTDKEFNKLFDRISKVVNLAGAGTPQEINKRLKQKMNEYRYLPRRNPLAIFKARSLMADLKRLIFAGFGRRTINEAVANPWGKIALTLKYGREKARQILRRRARRRRRW